MTGVLGGDDDVLKTDGEDIHEDNSGIKWLYMPCSDASWLRADDMGINASEEMAKVRSTLSALYDSGTPFFTREALQDLDKQLKSSKLGQKVQVRGLDDTFLDFTIETGRIVRVGRPGMMHEHIFTAPTILYFAFEHLLRQDEASFIPRLAYCTLQVGHWAGVRDKLSGEMSTPPLRPYEEVQAYFETIRNSWKASETCTRLKFIISSALPNVNKIVGFALGELSREPRSPVEMLHRRSAYQHALLLTLQDHFGEINPQQTGITSYAQDPAYNDIDKMLLRDHGVTVVDDPEGFLHADNSSAVISIRPDAPIKAVISDLARPALIIWNKVGEWNPQVSVWDHINKCTVEVVPADPDSPRVGKMVNDHYDAFEFPGQTEDFGELAIYIRRSSPEVPAAPDRT